MITSMFVSINLEYESIVAFYLHATVSYPIFTHDGFYSCMLCIFFVILNNCRYYHYFFERSIFCCCM